MQRQTSCRSPLRFAPWRWPPAIQAPKQSRRWPNRPPRSAPAPPRVHRARGRTDLDRRPSEPGRTSRGAPARGLQQDVLFHRQGAATRHHLRHGHGARETSQRRQQGSDAAHSRRFIPVARDQLLPALAAGMGDIATGGLTVTPEGARASISRRLPPRTSARSWSPRPMSRRPPPRKSYPGAACTCAPRAPTHESLVALNARLTAAGKKPVEIVARGGKPRG